MSIRKRALPSGQVRWLYDYKDAAGVRRAKMFATLKAAKDHETTVRDQLRTGTHTPDSASITVTLAAKLWIERAERDGLEASTVRQYQQHIDLHILPLLGAVRLSRLTTPMVESFKDTLLSPGDDPNSPREPLSRALARAVLGSLKGILKEAKRLGKIGSNPAAGVVVRISNRDEEEVVIPTREHIAAVIAKSAVLFPLATAKTTRKGKQKITPCAWRPLIVTAIFSGLRCSELRGLTWDQVDLAAGKIRVRQRADFKNQMGPPKSKAGRRDVPLSPLVINTLRTWKAACPPTKLNLVFPAQHKDTAINGITTNGTIHRSCWGPLQRACGLVEATPRLDAEGQPVLDKDGQPVIDAIPLYTFHALRHAAASLFIEQGWTPKKVQTVMGHSSIQMTYDVYGHLFPSADDDQTAMAQIEARLGLKA